MEYMIYVVSGSTVRGTLVVAWEAIVDNTRTFVADPTNRVNSVAIDLCGSTATHVSVAPSTEFPTLQCHFIPKAAKENATKYNSNGQLVFYLQTEVTCPKTTPFSVDIHIFERAGEDMRFGVPRSVVPVTNTTASLATQVKLEADAAGRITDPLLTHTNIELVPGGSDYSANLVQWGEEFMSVRPLVQRFGCVGTGRVKSGQVGLLLPHFFPPPAEWSDNNAEWSNFTQGGAFAAGVSNLVPWTWSGYFSGIFVGVRGSTRFKYMLDEPVDNTVPFAAATAVSSHDAISLATVGMNLEAATGVPQNMLMNMQMPTVENGMEVVFPCYGQFKYWCPRWCNDINAGANWGSAMRGFHFDAIFPVTRRSLPTFFGWTIFTAYGADFSATRFRRVPRVWIGSQA